MLDLTDEQAQQMIDNGREDDERFEKDAREKVVIEGWMQGWEIGSDWAATDTLAVKLLRPVGATDGLRDLSGGRVRVTIERLPEPEPKCPHCGGVLDWSALASCPIQHEARCRDCAALGWGKTKAAALDALAEWLKPCPRCGGYADYVRRGVWWYAKCSSEDCGIESTRATTIKRLAAAWWNKREGKQ